MMDAGGVTLGGLLVVTGWLGLRIGLMLGQLVADELRIFAGVRRDGPGAIAADDHAADDDASRAVHGGGVDPVTVHAASGNLARFTTGQARG